MGSSSSSIPWAMWHSLWWQGGCLRTHDAPALSVLHHAQQSGSGLFRPVFNIVQPGLPSVCLCVVFPLLCLAEWSHQTVPTGDVAIQSQFPSLNRGKARFLAANEVGDLLSDELTRPVLCVWDAQKSSVAPVARMPAFLSPDRLWGSNFRIRTTGWRPLRTRTFSTLLESWCSCSSRWPWLSSWPTRPNLVLSSPPLLSCLPLLSWNLGNWGCPLL